MTTTEKTKVEISAEDFARTNRGLIKLLRTIQDYGFERYGISTRRLCFYGFNSRNYGMQMIHKALEYGYIRRKKNGKETMNLLTAKGKRLLDKLK
jgi:predicted transcriptional regulator